jgi:HK97 family phage portal protein
MSIDFPFNTLSQGWQFLLADHGTAGIPINRNTILSSPFWWRGINIISSTIGRLPYSIYRRNKDGGRIVDEEHFAYDWLCYPNPYVTRHDLIKTAIAEALTHGNGYLRIKWGDYPFKPILAYVLDPELTWPARFNGELWYQSFASTGAIVVEPEINMGQLMKLRPYEVIHIRGYSFDGLVGVPVIQLLKDALSSGIGLQRYLNTFLRKGGAIQKQITLPGFFKNQEELEEFKKGFHEKHQTLEQSNDIPVFQGGAELKATGQTMRDAQMSDTRDFEIKVIAACLGLPPHLLGSIESQSYGTLEQENRSLLQNTLEPWLVAVESEFNLKILSTTQQKRDSHYFSFNRQALERGDMQTETKSLIDQVNAGLLTLNQALALRDLPGMGEAGDKHRMPTNLSFQEDVSIQAEAVALTDQPVADVTEADEQGATGEPIEEQENDTPDESGDADDNQGGDDKAERQIQHDVKRLLTRWSKNKQPLDAIDRDRAMALEALPAIEPAKVEQWLGGLVEELRATLPEQYPAVFARHKEKVWKTTSDFMKPV